MQSRVYVMVRYPSVCPIYRPLQQRAAGLLLLVIIINNSIMVIIVIQLLLGNRYRRRTLKRRSAENASSVTFTATVQGWTQTCFQLYLAYKKQGLTYEAWTAFCRTITNLGGTQSIAHVALTSVTVAGFVGPARVAEWCTPYTTPAQLQPVVSQ